MRWAPLILLLLISASEAIKPNILFIYLDDFGWRDTSYSGSDFYETPNIDKLAKGGMAFSNAYAAAANCAPSRASMITGTYSPRHQIYNVGTKPRGKTKFRKLEHISGKSSLSPGVKTWSKFAQESGYKTASIGKWHLGKDPKDHGFDINISGSQSGSPPKGYFPPHGKVPGLEQVGENEYLTDSLTNETIKFIRKNSNKPWLTYLSHFAVHTPLQAKTKDINKFKNKAAGILHNHIIMAGMIKAVDDGVGKIISTLNELKIKENTIIIFYSDNGGYGPATSMHPLKGYKGTYYEGGIRVPFFVNWPNVVASDTHCSTPITGVDIYPTICEMIIGQNYENHKGDGVSIVPLLKGNKIKDRALYWHFPAYLQSYQRADEQPDPLFRARPCSVIRKGRWKLIEYFENNNVELFDLNEDIGEKNNLSKRRPEIAKSLKTHLDIWRKKTAAAVPMKKNPDYDAEAERRAIIEFGKTNN